MQSLSHWLVFVCLVVSVGFPALASAETFEIGDGQPYTSIGAVPWESLAPGDRVRIHWRAAAYHEKWVIGRRGTEAEPIVIEGVPNASGQLPVIDGRDATTRPELNYWNEARGVIKFGGSNTPSEIPAWIVLQNLDVRSARPPYAFTGRDGAGSYVNNAAAVYIEIGEHITIRGCTIRDSGNGLFIGANEGQTRDILIEGNWIYDNGIEGQIYEHNSYTSAIGITFQYNHYGPLRTGCDGNNLKDRSAGLVVRYNWIESGNRQLDLVDAEDSHVLVDHPSYHQTFVYGNVLVEHEGDGNGQMVHYGGDSGTLGDYRKGTLHFFNNTLVSTRDGNTTLIRLSSNGESADVRNNIVFVTAGGSHLAMLSDHGTMNLSHNWMSEAWRTSFDSFDGTLNDDGSGIDGADPEFVNLGAQDYHLSPISGARDAATGLAAGAATHPLTRQYVVHTRSEDRPVDGVLDIGAFEVCEGACDPGDDVGGDDTGRDAGQDAPQTEDAQANEDVTPSEDAPPSEDTPPSVDTPAADVPPVEDAPAAEDAPTTADVATSEDVPVGTDDAPTRDGDTTPPSDPGAGGSQEAVEGSCGCSVARNVATPSVWFGVLLLGLLGFRCRRLRGRPTR